MKTAFNRFLLLCVTIALAIFGEAYAQDTSQVPPFPSDLSVAGMEAMTSGSGDSSIINGLMAPEVLQAVREYIQETQKQGLDSRAGTLSISAVPTNVRANNPAGDAVGETQSEVAVAVFGDTVVIGWNDSKGFTAGNTISSYAYSLDGGATFTDGGNVPLQVAGDQAFGDPGVDTDEKGNWYYNQIYTKTGQQNIGVHHGKFVAGVLVWDTPVMASIGTSAAGLLDKCLLACDRVTGNVYVAYTRFTSIPQIEVVRSTTNGATWNPPIVLDNTTTPTSSKQAARPFCGPNGEVYVVWEKGANTINCPDVSGNVVNSTGVIAFTRSLNNGVSYDPFTSIGTVNHSWTWSGPGDLRERANDFPDIAVDRSGGSFNANIYVTWHESAPWTANLSAGPLRAEATDVANNNPGGAEPFLIGENVTGSSSSTADLDYWQFSATQGQSLLFNLDPLGFNCGVSGTSRGLRMRLFATQTPYPNPAGFPDTLLAASALGAFAQRIVWTAPKTGTYLVRLQPSTTAIGTYTLRVRNLTFGAPSPARDARDVVVVRSTNQGANWSSEQLVNDDPPGLENRRPFITADGLGRVHIFWHDSRLPGLGSNAALTNIFGTTSTDAGSTWSANYLVTDEPSFFSFNTRAVPNLGDYNQAAATATGVVHPAWSDQRISTGDVRVPNANTFSAGRGPDAYTTAVSPPVTTCPANISVGTASGQCTQSVSFTVTATGVPAPVVECKIGSTVITSPHAFPIGTTTVTCTATNGIGSPATCSFTVTVVDNEPPTITCPGDIIVEGNIFGQCGATVNPGTPSASDNCSFSVAGVRSDAKPLSDPYPLGITTITWTAIDASTNLASCTQKITVTNPAPVVSMTSPPSGALYAIGSTVNFTGSYTDNAGGTHTATWMADANSFSGTVNEGTQTVSASYTFTAAGVYLMQLTVDDGCGGSGTTTTVGGLDAIVVIYDPNAGFVTGGGWIESPAGAYRVDLSLTGKANFGFVSKYQKGKSIPTGETEFQFKVGNLNFHSSLYEWLVISGSKAQYKGSGTINNGGNYGFMLTATDGQLSGGGGVDKFRMKIWDKGNGDAIVYDNQYGGSDNSDPTTAIAGGSIVVHKNPAKEGIDPTAQIIPTTFALNQSYPNPFNPTTTIGFDLPKDSKVSLVIYNSLGEEIRRLVDTDRSAGRYSVVWDGLNGNGNQIVSGIYIYRLTAIPATGGEPFVRVMKTVMMK